MGSFFITSSTLKARSSILLLSKSNLAFKNSKKPTESKGGMCPSSTVISSTPVWPSMAIGTKTTCKALAEPPIPAGVITGLSTLMGCKPTIRRASVSSVNALDPMRSWVAPVSTIASPHGSDKKDQLSCALMTVSTTSRKSLTFRKVKAELMKEPSPPP